MDKLTHAATVVLVALAGCGGGEPEWLDPVDPPIVPVGIDGYLQWERWPMLRIGTRTVMRSTYDRAGGNEGVDASHFLRAETLDRFVTLDLEGPGSLAFVRTNRWHGSPWHYEIDGDDLVVGESSTATPNAPVPGGTFLPVELFPAPLASTWATTNGADLSWIPIPFARSFVLAYERTHYGTGYYIAQIFPERAANLSRPIATWDRSPPPRAALELLERAGEDLAPIGATGPSGTVDLLAGAPTRVVELEGPATLRALRFVVAREDSVAFGHARLRITWDDRALPSIDAPLALFFGAGTLFNRDGREWLVRGLASSIRTRGDEVELGAYWPMPFFRRARVEIESPVAIAGVRWELRALPLDEKGDRAGYFHATYHDFPTPEPGRDLVLLDTTVDEGGGVFCGSFVGTSLIFSESGDFGTLEGDPRFYFDGARSPQAYGTGTEELHGGGDYWGGRTMTLPLAGHPVGAPSGTATEPEDAIESAYRFFLTDLFPFGRSARIQLEHGGADESNEHYRTVAFWYGLPGPCLVPTDELDVGDPASEAAHAYVTPDSGDVVVVRSRWDAGPGVQDEESEDGRVISRESRFVLAIDPRNAGVLLRRTLDYGWADQRAEVFVGDADHPDRAPERAGTWYLAGSTRTVYSNPTGELDAATPIVQDPGRRLREDEFLIAPAFTRGRSQLAIRIVPTGRGPVWPRPLLPGEPPPPDGWSELRYRIFIWTLPPRI